MTNFLKKKKWCWVSASAAKGAHPGTFAAEESWRTKTLIQWKVGIKWGNQPDWQTCEMVLQQEDAQNGCATKKKDSKGQSQKQPVD